MRRSAGILLTSAVIFPLLALRVMANSPPGAEFGTNYIDPGLTIVFILITVVPPMVITCFSEWLVAGLFNIHRKYDRLIVLTNLVSQISMWVLVFAAVLLIPGFATDVLTECYGGFLLALELPIYAAEFLVYRKRMPEVSRKRCLLYAATANTVSLLLGLLYSRMAFGF